MAVMIQMDKPKICAVCPFSQYHTIMGYYDEGSGSCCITGDYIPDYDADELHPNCPLVSVDETELKFNS